MDVLMVTNYTSVAMENATNYASVAMENTTTAGRGESTVKLATTSPCLNCNCLTDTTQVEPPSDNLSVNGGFIAMAAGLSVVVPLICVLVMQLRRAKREERERERRRPEVNGGESGVTDPPPSYEQVFGSSYQSASPVHSRNSSMDTLIQERETPGRPRETAGRDNAAYVAILGLHGGVGDRGLVSPLELGVATISGSHVIDIPVSLIASQLARPHEAVSSTIGWDNSRPSTSHAGVHSPVLHSSDQPSSSPSTSSSTALPPPPPPLPPPPPPPRSPPPPFSSWSFRNPNRNTGTSRIQETLRRLPGMHISIEDFFASLRGVQDNENPGPPPSYEEALKILESAAMAKERKSIIK